MWLIDQLYIELGPKPKKYKIELCCGNFHFLDKIRPKRCAYKKSSLFFFQVGEQGFLTWLALAETKSPDRATLMLTFIGPSTQQQIALVLRQSPSEGSVVTLSNYKGTQ